MAFAQSIDFQRPSSQLSAIDQKPTSSFFDDLDLPEEPLLEGSMISPTNTDDRRDSFGNGASTVFSPQSTGWEEYSTGPAMPERQFTHTNPFVEQSNNPFMRGDSTIYGQHNPQWMFDQSAESRTSIMPTPYDSYNGDYDAPSSSTFAHVVPAPSAFNRLPQGNVRPASVFPPAATPISMPTSPVHDSKDWMSLAEASTNTRPHPKRARGNSPQRHYPDFARREHPGGIRKKNARFEIPEERNLQTIDILIANSTNEDETKELKQQKRLLRNRQAAYDTTLMDDFGLLVPTEPCRLYSWSIRSFC
jgi:hypothetical protein